MDIGITFKDCTKRESDTYISELVSHKFEIDIYL